MNQYNGLIIEPIKDTDFLMGAESGIVPQTNLANGDWEKYLAPNESQKQFGEWDMFACVSFSAVKTVTTTIHFMLDSNLLKPETVKFLEDSGYLKDGIINLSDRFIAKMSGTTINGNSFARVWDAIRKCGMLPESDWAMPTTDYSSSKEAWNEYYKEIPQELKDKALKFLDYFDIKYEWVLTGVMDIEKLKKALQQAPLQIGTPVKLPEWNQEVVPAIAGIQASHATEEFRIDKYHNIHDQYAPYYKKLALEYSIPYAVKGVIIEKKPPEQTPFSHLFLRSIRFGQSSFEVSCLQEALRLEGLINILPTGYFGKITLKAVKDFQIKYGIDPVGEVGPITRKRLNSIYAPDFIGSTWLIDLMEFFSGLIWK
jgi:peptidoglycan hydrolase-like protein with peptidoglycan-binding domain